jgi:hypothetical protein
LLAAIIPGGAAAPPYLPPARLTAYLQQQVEQDSLTAFSTASRVSPVRF